MNGKRYFIISGQVLKELRNSVTFGNQVYKSAPKLTLWIEQGHRRLQRTDLLMRHVDRGMLLGVIIIVAHVFPQYFDKSDIMRFCFSQYSGSEWVFFIQHSKIFFFIFWRGDAI